MPRPSMALFVGLHFITFLKVRCGTVGGHCPDLPLLGTSNGQTLTARSDGYSNGHCVCVIGGWLIQWLVFRLQWLNAKLSYSTGAT